MNTILVLSIIYISCTLLLLINNGNNRKLQRCLTFVFCFLTVFLGIRYMFGNDYISYLYQYKKVKEGVDYSYSWYESILYNESASEPGWVLINRCFSSTSFALLVFVLTVVEFYILYNCIKKYVSPHLYWFSIFIFLINPSNMLTCISMMRQYLAMTIFIFAIRYIIDKKIIKYFLLIISATFIHTSAIILLPVYFIGNINASFLKKDIIKICLTVIIAFWYMVGAYYFGDIVQNLLGLSLFQRYDVYADNDVKSISLGFSAVLNIFLFYLGISSIKNSTREEAILILITLIGILILPLGTAIPHITRLSFYFTYALIFVCPILLTKIRRRSVRFILVMLMMIFYINTLVSFIDSPINKEVYSTYHTIFSSIAEL